MNCLKNPAPFQSKQRAEFPVVLLNITISKPISVAESHFSKLCCGVQWVTCIKSLKDTKLCWMQNSRPVSTHRPPACSHGPWPSDQSASDVSSSQHTACGSTLTLCSSCPHTPSTVRAGQHTAAPPTSRSCGDWRQSNIRTGISDDMRL